MTNNLDALLTALYVHLDDHVLPALGWSRDHRPGRKPALSDAELACVAVAQHLLGIASERRWIRYARQNVDSAPLPCAASRETVKRPDLAGHAGYGYCASHSRFFWGFRLYLITTAGGMPLIRGLAHPGLGEREVTRALLERDHQLIRAGQVILGGKGFAGKDFEASLTGMDLHPIRPARKDEPRRPFPGWLRQRVEASIWTLKGQLGLGRHAGRVPAGLWARVVQRLLALNAASWHNWATGATVKRSLIAYDH